MPNFLKVFGEEADFGDEGKPSDKAREEAGMDDEDTWGDRGAASEDSRGD